MAKQNLLVPEGTKINLELTTDQLVDIARQLRYNVCFTQHEKTKIAGKTSTQINQLLQAILKTENVKEAK